MPYNDRPIPEAFQCRRQDPPPPRPPKPKAPPLISNRAKVFLMSAAVIGLVLHPAEKPKPPEPQKKQEVNYAKDFGSPDYTAAQPKEVRFHGSDGVVKIVDTPCIPYIDITETYKAQLGN